MTMAIPDVDDDDIATGGMMPGEVMDRLGSLESAVEALVAEGEDSAATLEGLQEQLGGMSGASGETLQEILQQLASLNSGENDGARRSSQGRHRSPAGDQHVTHRHPSAEHKHHHQHQHHSHHASHGQASPVRAKSPGPAHGTVVMRERPQGRSASPPVGLGAAQASSNGRRSVPNMRQQMAAMAALNAGVKKVSQKVPTMREQMAAAQAKMSAANALT